MAITENSFTEQEIAAAVAANPTLKGVVGNALKTLGGFKVIPDAEYDSLAKTIADTKKSGWASKMETDIKEVSGRDKLPNETHYDYYKRVHGEDIQKTKELDKKVKDLEKQIAAGSTDTTLQAQLTALQAEKQDLTEKTKTLEKEKFDLKISFEINKGLAKFTPKADIPKGLIDIYIESVEKQIQAAAKEVNGKIIYLNEKNETILNDKAQPATAEYILNDRLKDYADTGNKQTGTETGKADKTEDTPTDKTLPTGLKTQKEVSEALIKRGVLDGTAEHTKMFSDYIEKNPELKNKLY